jgi:carboxylesterase
MLLLGGWGLLSDHLVTRADRNAERVPGSNVRVGFEERTLGPEDSPGAVLFVHGFVGCGNNFADLPDRLAEQGWRVRVVLLPGHGTSPRDYARQTPETLLRAVREEVRELHGSHGRVVLVGHSMGGALSTLAAAEEGADGLVLAGAYFGVTHRPWYGLHAETWTRLVRPVLRWVYKGELFIQVNRPEAKKEILTYTWVPVQGLLTLQELGVRARAPETLSRVTCPVLMLHSHGDVAASPEWAATALEGMASVEKRIVWYERSNHHLFWDHDRDDVMEQVVAFLGPPE